LSEVKLSTDGIRYIALFESITGATARDCLLQNLLQPANANNIKIGYKGDRRIAYVEVKTKEKGLAIGRNGKNIEKVKVLAKRHHDIDDVTIQ
jgi:N utilization substance protein A